MQDNALRQNTTKNRKPVFISAELVRRTRADRFTARQRRVQRSRIRTNEERCCWWRNRQQGWVNTTYEPLAPARTQRGQSV